jgi:SH3-like domain-containing protein
MPSTEKEIEMSLSLVKTGVIAASVLMMSATMAMAAPHGTINYDTKIKWNHSSSSPTVGWAYDGDDVIILGGYGSWYKIKDIDEGDKGWVKKSAVDVYGGGGGGGGGGSPVNACFWGPYGYICVNP